jgi:hypothetical protein
MPELTGNLIADLSSLESNLVAFLNVADTQEIDDVSKVQKTYQALKQSFYAISSIYGSELKPEIDA